MQQLRSCFVGEVRKVPFSINTVTGGDRENTELPEEMIKRLAK